MAQAIRLRSATGLAPAGQALSPVQAWSGRQDWKIIEAERERRRPGSGIRRAAYAMFREARVVNFTNVQHQLFSRVSTGQFGNFEGGDWSGQPSDHVVNKWERAHKGEEGLVGYDQNADKLQAQLTLRAEAHALKVAVEEYAQLDAPLRMQFALLDYGQNLDFANAYGKSRFVIGRTKCKSDGFVHFGDSGVNGFGGNRGSYKDFGDRLLADDDDARTLAVDHQAWVEVQLKGGVALPGDLDRFEVDRGELAILAPHVPKELAEEVGAMEAMETALGNVFGDKLHVV